MLLFFSLKNSRFSAISAFVFVYEDILFQTQLEKNTENKMLDVKDDGWETLLAEDGGQ